jgi:hypothetical protein
MDVCRKRTMRELHRVTCKMDGGNMKLLYCPVCDDVVRLIDSEWRMCMCHRSGGQYNLDSLTAVIGGKGKVFGIPNPIFSEAYMAGPKVIESLRKKYDDSWITEVWWGEYKGDWQLIRVKNPMGPIPRNWEKRVRKLKESGGVSGYEGRTEIENQLRDKWKGNALLRVKFQDMANRMWQWWGRKTVAQVIKEQNEQIANLQSRLDEIIKVKSTTSKSQSDALAELNP